MCTCLVDVPEISRGATSIFHLLVTVKLLPSYILFCYRFSPEVAAVVGNIMRRLPVTVNQRALLGVLSVALVERAKRVGILGSSVSSRRIQRKYHTGLILPMEQLRQILNESEL